MLDKINQIYNINFAPKHSGRQILFDEPVSNPIRQEVNFRGSEVLASYNSVLINQSKKFDIPELVPIVSLDKMNEIKGERIYNSSGELVQIIDEDERYTTTYTPSKLNNNIFEAEVWDKKAQRCVKWQNFYNSVDGNTYFTIAEDNNGLHTDNFFNYDNGKLILYNKSKDLDEKNTICYSYDKEEYWISKDDAKIIYDKNKKVKQIIDYDDRNKRSVRTSYINDKPVSIETRTFNSILESCKDVNPFNDPDLKPCEYYEIGNTENIQGQKFYYSNGKLEKVVTPDGKIYSYGLNGELESLKDGNKTIYSNQGHNEIEEDLGNGNTRTTQFHKNKQPYLVEYSNGDAYKRIGQLPDNSIYYQQCDDGYSVYSIEYDKNRNITGSQIWYHDDNEE